MSVVHGFLRQVYVELIALGWYWTGLPPVGNEPRYAVPYGQANGSVEPGRAPLPDAEGPPPGHPERLRPDVPLSEAERSLRSRLYA
ncbi:hypothetical protein AMK26_33245 [Streptomyces sp. CB03234]|uniref:DUF6059 family protein n=1 Tax=Streptomyces sp. (strain CB03234) TaxID=1703937 RepID=UPI00093DD1F0|nr:DUF6059 family protein [Streptomyces sp. CB03234]OKJ94660.1 hypothetical protein AMK26_33245 [Streptomyces sp. CB03234]